MVFELRLNAAMKRSYQLKGGWEPGSRMDEKSQRTGDRWLRVVHSFTYRASKFDGNSLENSRQRYRWYRYIGRPNICASLQPRYPLVSHRFQYSIVIGLMFRKLWNSITRTIVDDSHWSAIDISKIIKILLIKRSWTILLSLIYDWRFYSYWSTIKLWKFYDISKIMKILLLERLWTILLSLIYDWYLENYENFIERSWMILFSLIYDKIMKILFVRSWTILLSLIYDWYLEN